MRGDQRARRDAFLDKIGRRPVVMGILNVTPDSFSDGGRFESSDAAVAHAWRMIEDGCDIVDVGGESTRPGAIAVSADDELQRIVPVLTRLAQETDATVSVDTSKAEVAARAIELGAVLYRPMDRPAPQVGSSSLALRSPQQEHVMRQRRDPR